MDIEKFCENLQSHERQIKVETLNKLLDFCEQESDIESVINVYSELYLHILNCYSDKFERCRETSIQVVSSFLEKLPRNDYFLQYVLQTIAKRIGGKEVKEDCEELRHLLLKQVNFLIRIYKEATNIDCDYLINSYNDIIDIFTKSLKDAYPEVLVETCSCISSLSVAGKSCFHHRSETLIPLLCRILSHRRSGCRIAAIQALTNVAFYVSSGKSEHMIQILTSIGPLLLDQMPLVRRECGLSGCRFLMDLRDRYSYFDRILPLVLSCLGDESLEIQEEINLLWVKCGEQFYEENENELNKFEAIPDEPKFPSVWKRSTLGCRALVQQNLKMVKVVLKEIEDWKEEVRLKSLKLLFQIVLHAERDISVLFIDIFPLLAKALSCRDKETETEAGFVTRILGIVLIYEDWSSYLLDKLQSNFKLGYLKCFYYLLIGSEVLTQSWVTEIVEVLCKNANSKINDENCQSYMLQIIEFLSNKQEQFKNKENASNSCDAVDQHFYHITVKIMASSVNFKNDKILQQAERILINFFKEVTVKNVHGKYLKSLLESSECLEVEIDFEFEGIEIINGLIIVCGFQEPYLPPLQNIIKLALSGAEYPDRIKLFGAVAIGMLSWNQDMNLDHENSTNYLKLFIEETISPHLQWKGGINAESLRSMAGATLCAMSQGAPKESKEIFPTLFEYFNSLIDDNNNKTRLFLLRSLININSITENYIKALGYTILKRLDDPIMEIRETAICTISLFDFEDGTEKDEWMDVFLNHTFSLLLLHFEDIERNIRKAIQESLLKLGRKKPKHFETAYNKSLDALTRKKDIEEIRELIFN